MKATTKNPKVNRRIAEKFWAKAERLVESIEEGRTWRGRQEAIDRVTLNKVATAWLKYCAPMVTGRVAERVFAAEQLPRMMELFGKYVGYEQFVPHIRRLVENDQPAIVRSIAYMESMSDKEFLYDGKYLILLSQTMIASEFLEVLVKKTARSLDYLTLEDEGVEKAVIIMLNIMATAIHSGNYELYAKTYFGLIESRKTEFIAYFVNYIDKNVRKISTRPDIPRYERRIVEKELRESAIAMYSGLNLSGLEGKNHRVAHA